MKPLEIISTIEQTAVPAGAAAWDKCGVQVAGRRRSVKSIAVALDASLSTVERALAEGVDFILTHHPLSMQPKFLDVVDDHYRIVAALLESGVWLYSAHTTLDANPQGPVSWLADELHLTGRCVVEPVHREELEAFAFSVSAPDASGKPDEPDKLDKLDALTARWSLLPGVQTVRRTMGMVHMTCRKSCGAETRSAVEGDLGMRPVFLAALPEGEPRTLGFGCIGSLPEAMTLERFRDRLAQIIDRDYWVTCGQTPGTIATVAYCTGSGAGMADAAFRMGADVFITGDVKYHAALDSIGCLMDVGHFCLEEEMMRRFALHLGSALPGVDIYFLPAQDPMRLAVRGAR
ncbi:Nif3-like dinuclear metal center hexameric protein [Desulfovibrio psychrotolerans]|uniref:GTP cyclohydrolase 1 type 2 homolog n=1 Tax=Desulfovibrio psychrotolerans TaxID=415242 RepID=A0A7J0BYV9_9BACT|nr:Nif3-like dinuclear metal center hexameric protein [Desulfovibrio psychrotolerans]GFM38352.1 hypothetical protein DSM19430T_30360 [Desulfovibrio psychrotolerans]